MTGALLHRRRARSHIRPAMPRTSLIRHVGVLAGRVPWWREMAPEALGGRVVVAASGALVTASSVAGARRVSGMAIGILLGWRAGVMLEARTTERDDAEVRAALPETLDRLTTCVLAGMSIERSLRLVAPATKGTLHDGLTAGLRALDAGVPRARAYEIIATRCGAREVRSLVDALSRAERYGASIATALLAHADELRAQARAIAEAEVRAAPVKMIFPLVFCFLPAFIVLVIGPIAISAVRALSTI